MIANNIRLSRISHPRATLWATALLIIVFLGFGVWADAAMTQDVGVILDNHPANYSWFAQIQTLFHNAIA